jgi:hypothetical protein
MAAADSYLPCQLRAGELHHGWNNNLIEKGCGEKTLGMGGDKNHRQTHCRWLGVAKLE